MTASAPRVTRTLEPVGTGTSAPLRRAAPETEARFRPPAADLSAARRPSAGRPPAAPRRPLNGLLRQELSGSSVLRLPRREMVYGSYGANRDNGGEDANLYIVESGYVKLVTPSRDGKECLLGIYTRGDVIGELCLGETKRYECAMTMTPAVVRRMPRAGLMAILDNPGVREEFVRYLAQRLLEQQQLITDFVTADSEHRFAAILLHLARKIGTRSDSSLLVIDARITQEEFAAMVGTTRSRVGLFLKHFVEAGSVLRGRRGVLAIDEARIEDYLEAC